MSESILCIGACMKILTEIPGARLAIEDCELAERKALPPREFVYSACRQCWVRPDVIAAERKQVRAEKRVY